MKPILDRRSAVDHGPYRAYCQVCWYAVYQMWIDTKPHNGACPLGHIEAHQCPDAMGHAEFSAEMAEIRLTRGAR